MVENFGIKLGFRDKWNQNCFIENTGHIGRWHWEIDVFDNRARVIPIYNSYVWCVNVSANLPIDKLLSYAPCSGIVEGNETKYTQAFIVIDKRTKWLSR